MASPIHEAKRVLSANDNSMRMHTIVQSSLAKAKSNNAVVYIDEGDGMATTWKSPVVIIIILFVFGLPLFIVIAIFWYRYMIKKKEYELAEKALAAQQDISAIFANKSAQERNGRKGIRNIFLGIGMGVFLWALTEEKVIAAIRLLIFCMGLGQVVIAYIESRNDSLPPFADKKNRETDKTQNTKEENPAETNQPSEK